MVLKKLSNINNYLLILFLPVAFLILLIILIFRPFCLIRIGQIMSYRFGHYIKEIELYLSHKKNNPEDFTKTYDLFFLSNITSNSYLEKNYSRQIKILPWQLFLPLYQLLKKIVFFKKNLIDLRYYTDGHHNELYDKIECQIKFTPKEIQTAEDLLMRIGITRNDKIVCLFARDENYASKYIYNYNPKNKFSYRNSDIEDYKLAAYEIVKLGYKVVRVGKMTKKKISYESNEIIDYSHSEIRSDFLDVYLAYRCDFAFGDSGTWVSAIYAFRKYVGSANWMPLDCINLFSKRNIFILKYLYDEKTKKKFSINEIYEKQLQSHTPEEFKKMGIKVINNSPEEILDLALEVEKKYSGNFLDDEENIKANEKFKNFLNEKNFYWGNFEYPQKRFTLRGSIEKNYLKKNFFIN